MMPIREITDAEFETAVLGADRPVLVDFWAEWCGPCKMMAPALDELAKELAGAVVIVKVNVDENPAAPARYGVRGVPTLILFRDGAVATTRVGPAPKTQLRAFVDEALQPPA